MLTRLYIHNYRCFLNFELRLSSLGLLLGYNGAGKSSIFEVLGMIQDLVIRNREVSDVAPSDTRSTFGDAGPLQRFKMDLDSPYGPVRYNLVIEQRTALGTSKIFLEEIYVATQRIFGFEDGRVQMVGAAPDEVSEFPFTAQRSFLASMDPEQGEPPLRWFLSFVSGIWILKLNPQQITVSSRKDEPWLERDGSNFPGWCRHLLLEERDRVKEAEQVLQGVITGFCSLTAQTAGRTRVLVVRFRQQGGKTYDLDFDMLSEGQRALVLLYIVLHITRGRAALLCFDKLDNFVAIREIQPFLDELLTVTEKQQVLLISHSSEVIDFIGPQRAHLLERPEGGATRVGELARGISLRLSELMARGWHVQR